MEIKGENYRERVNHQIEEWAKGNSIHNKVDDECCPDFSCCRPELLSPEEHRKTFAAANEEQRQRFLFGFLGKAISKIKPKVKVHIVDGKNEIESQLN